MKQHTTSHLMRYTLLLILLPLQAQAWTFVPGPICGLFHQTEDARIELTYDPSKPLYSVTISRPDALPKEPVFTMRFIGPAGRTIATDRHLFSQDDRAVTANDRGFGNVLDGLQFNDTALAILGDTVLAFPLEGAADPVQDFRTCAPQAGA